MDTRCKHMTQKGDLCWQHQKALHGLRIKDSELPGAGQGLFTTKPIPAGATICQYTGDIVVELDPNYGNPYALMIKKKPATYIDASRTNTAVGRFVNDARGQGENNSLLLYDRKAKTGYLKAARDIEAGEEILTDYGPDYWENTPVVPNLKKKKGTKVEVPQPKEDAVKMVAEIVHTPQVKRKVKVAPVPVHQVDVKKKAPKKLAGSVHRDELGNDMRPSVYHQEWLDSTDDPNYFKQLEARAAKLGYKDKTYKGKR